MATRQEIARRVAKEAAKAAYATIMGVKIEKVAGTNNFRGPSISDIAKQAAKTTYEAVLKLGQAPAPAPIAANKPLAVRCPQCPTIAEAIDHGGRFTLNDIEAEWPAFMAVSDEVIPPDEKARIKAALQAVGARI